MSNQKNEQGFWDIVTKEEFKVLYDALEYVNIPFSTDSFLITVRLSIPLPF